MKSLCITLLVVQTISSLHGQTVQKSSNVTVVIPGNPLSSLVGKENPSNSSVISVAQITTTKPPIINVPPAAVDLQNHMKRILTGLFNMDTIKTGEKSMVDFFNGVMHNSSFRDTIQQVLSVSEAINVAQTVLNDPNNMKNMLIQTALQNVPFNSLDTQFGEATNVSLNNLVSAVDTGKVPNMSDSPLNLCKDMVNCNVVDKEFENVKNMLNMTDKSMMSNMLKNPISLLDVILKGNQVEMPVLNDQKVQKSGD